MPDTTQRLLTESFYESTITENIASTGDVDFAVASPPTNSKWFIIISPDIPAKRERMYYHNVSGSRIYVKWINRTELKSHLSWDTIQINDTSDLFNFFSDNISTTWYVEKQGWLNVTVWWWPTMLYWTTTKVASDTNLTLANNATNYIYYIPSTNVITYTTTFGDIAANEWVCLADVVTASSLVSSIAYRQYRLWAVWVWPTWPEGPTGVPWADGADGADWAEWPTWPEGPTWPIWPTWLASESNTFTAENTFTENTIFEWQVETPFNDIGSVSSATFTFDASTANNQKVTLTGATDHTCNFNNLKAWVYVLFVAQSGSGTLKFAIGTGCTPIVNVNVIWASFDNSTGWATTTWTHIFTILAAVTWAHVSYIGESI